MKPYSLIKDIIDREQISGFYAHTHFQTLPSVDTQPPPRGMLSPSLDKQGILAIALTHNELSVLENALLYAADNGVPVRVITRHGYKTPDGLECLDLDTLIAQQHTKTLLMMASNPLWSLSRIYQRKRETKKRVYKLVSMLLALNSVFQTMNPRIALFSNDHSPQQRSFHLLGHHHNATTVYVQHASVSTVFPRLTMDYAFLDGQASYDIYQTCQKNQPPRSIAQSQTRCFLSGQKKHIATNTTMRTTNPIYGLAINALDNLEDYTLITKTLLAKGIPVIVRPHPMLENAEAKFQEFSHDANFSFLPNSKQSLVDFFQNITVIVSGNSSILLEAALANVTPFYLQPNPGINDYYGFVAQGIAKRLKKPTSILEKQGFKPKTTALQHYSVTHETSWQNKEQHLLGRALLDILNNTDIKDFKPQIIPSTDNHPVFIPR